MKKKALRCRKCEKEMKELQISRVDVFAIFNSPTSLYCGNKKCEWFGVVVVSGLK